MKGTLIGRTLRCEDEGDCGEVLKMGGIGPVMRVLAMYGREMRAGNDGRLSEPDDVVMIELKSWY